MDIIAKIRSDYKEKFGIPRQSLLVKNTSRIIFEPEYRNIDAVKGLEGFSHIWLIWNFSESKVKEWSATVRPPRLGGNVRRGVFATRSPYRPNPLGLSSVKLIKIEYTQKYGAVLYVEGADLMDETPIYDIKPYVVHSDCHPEAVSGFSDNVKDYELAVEISEDLLSVLPKEKQQQVVEILKMDPRPSYHNDCERIYGFNFAGFEIKFKVENEILSVISIELEK